MQTLRAKIKDVQIGRYGCDTAFCEIGKETIQICFNKCKNIAQYAGKDIFLVEENGIYELKPERK